MGSKKAKSLQQLWSKAETLTLETIVHSIRESARLKGNPWFTKMGRVKPSTVDHIKSCIGLKAEAAIRGLQDRIAQGQTLTNLNNEAKRCPRCQEKRQKRKNHHQSGTLAREIEAAQQADAKQHSSGTALATLLKQKGLTRAALAELNLGMDNMRIDAGW